MARERQEKKFIKGIRKRLGFLQKNYPFFLAPFITLFLFFLTLAIYKAYPFGEYTVASYDLSAQICPFIEHLFDVFQGKSSLSYSYAIAGGADVLGTFLYFFISPFSFLFLLCGDGKVLQAASFVIPIKVACIAFVGVWFARKLFENIPDYLCLAVGVLYAYCGYTFVANTYINWLDFLIYLPLCVWAFVQFRKTGKVLLWSVFMACCVYTCFSIACFSMFTVFPLLMVYGFVCVEKGGRKTYLSRVCVAFVITVLLALPILIPALSAYLQSGRGGGLFDNVFFGFSQWPTQGFSQFDNKWFLETWGDSLFRKWTYILSDSVFFVLTVIWLIRQKIKTPLSKFMLYSGILTLIPTLVDESMLLLNMGSYMSYALRFGFLNAVYFLGGACLALESFYRVKTGNEGGRVALNAKKGGIIAEGTVEKIPQKTLRNTVKRKKIWTSVFLLVTIATFAFLVWFIANGNYKKMWEGVVKDSSLRSTLKSFSGRFAHSLGGLEAIAPLFGVVAAITIFGIVLAWKKKVSKQVVSFALLFIVGAQAVFYNNQLVVGNLSNVSHIEDYKTLSAALNERDDTYFRVKDYGDDFTANLPFTGDSNSFSVFSSVIDKNNFVIRNLFGYMGNGTNSLKSAHSNESANPEFGDSFLGYKYYFVSESDKGKLDKDWNAKKYVNAYMVGGNHGEKVQLSSGTYYVYENEIVFPFAYRVQGGSFRFLEENDWDSNHRRANQRALYAYLKGVDESSLGWSDGYDVTPELIRALSQELHTRAASELEVGKGKITAVVKHAKDGENLFLNFMATKGYKAYVNGEKVELVDNDLHFLCVPLQAGENRVELIYTSPYFTLSFVGILAGVGGLLAVAFVLKKTKIFEKCELVIAWAGVALAIACVAFFFLFPTCVWIWKLFKLLL